MKDEELPSLDSILFKMCSEILSFHPSPSCLHQFMCQTEGNEESRPVNILSSTKRGRKTSENVRAKNTVNGPVGKKRQMVCEV